MRSIAVEEAQARVEAALELRAAREVPPAEDDPPVVGEDRTLQALDEAVGPGMAGRPVGAGAEGLRANPRRSGFGLSYIWT
jgi:hypothetical protein